MHIWLGMSGLTLVIKMVLAISVGSLEVCYSMTLSMHGLQPSHQSKGLVDFDVA